MTWKILSTLTFFFLLVSLVASSLLPARSVFAETTWTTTTVDATGDVGWSPSLALGSDGFARISYFDATNNDLKFVQCTNADCSIKNTATVDSAGNVGPDTSLALGEDGFARISYYDSTNDDLKFALEGGSTPTPTSSPSNNGSSSSSSSSSSSTPSAPSCGDQKPNGTPNLFQIDVNNTQATLYFTPVSGANKYFISYGNGSENMGTALN